ncbi:hypothetical protein [Clostridium fallax]|uniref:Flagellar protein FliT n=1 Tax=Clostridium fallax TaxID=1533 RepID=A0A1M4ULR5_9CLOT|nr:hypothetical protein [Clostridium fallax]SHE57595.1 hypothetical protein SAMN05443638_10586 [Clostridium fallax]SQB07632.1 Uncharacterised protein [Clostridium fallax]
MEVKEKLLRYKAFTENIIENLKNDNLDNLESNLFERQKIINELLEIKDLKENNAKLGEELIILEKELNKIYREKKEEYKKKLSENNKSMMVNKTYGNNVSKINGLVNLKI